MNYDFLATRVNIVSLIKKRVLEYEEIGNDLLSDYRQSNSPISNEIKERYNNLGSLIDGLNEAIDIIVQMGEK